MNFVAVVFDFVFDPFLFIFRCTYGEKFAAAGLLEQLLVPYQASYIFITCTVFARHQKYISFQWSDQDEKLNKLSNITTRWYCS